MRFVAAACLVCLALPVAAQEIDTHPEPKIVFSNDLSALPKAVAATRRKLIEAASTGNIEALRPIIEAQQYPPEVSYGGTDDPLEYLTTYSADGQGIENLAILLDLLDAPYAIFDSEGDNPSYVWPYLAVHPDLSSLTPLEKLDAYRLISHEELNELIGFEAWFYWRVYIAKNGDWEAFIAGD